MANAEEANAEEEGLFDLFRQYSFWWLSWYYNLPIFPNLSPFSRATVLALIFGAVVFSIGLLVASLGGFPRLYLSPSASSPIYLGILGISYFVFAFYWLLPRYAKRIFDVQPFLDISPDQFGALVDEWANRVCDNRSNLILSAASVLAFVLVGDYLWTRPNLEGLLQQYPILNFIAFMPSPKWYQVPIWPKLLILDLIGVFVVPDMALSARVVFLQFELISRISQFSLRSIYLFRSALFRFREVASFSRTLAMNYSVGIWLGIIVVSPRARSPVTVGIIILLSACALAITLIPHLLLSRMLSRTKRLLLKHLLDSCLTDPLLRVQPTSATKYKDVREALQRDRFLYGTIEQINSMPMWQYRVSLRALLGQLPTFALTVVKFYELYQPIREALRSLSLAGF